MSFVLAVCTEYQHHHFAFRKSFKWITRFHLDVSALQTVLPHTTFQDLPLYKILDSYGGQAHFSHIQEEYKKWSSFTLLHPLFPMTCHFFMKCELYCSLAG